jgi:hypothetical protein
MRTGLSVSFVTALLVAAPPPVLAQSPEGPPPTLVIYREEVKPGKAAAHTANELNWAGMMAKAQWPTGWLGTVSVTGPSEAWFFSGFGSIQDYDKDRLAQDAAESLRDAEKYSALDGDMLLRTSTMIATYRPELSYQSTVALPKMRYFSVDTIVVKPGYAGDFAERWREIVAAHTASKMDEHWAVYEVTSGAAAGTFLFFYPMETLAPLDASAAKHRAQAYRDAVGERGRMLNSQLTKDAVLSQQNRILAFNPKMSHLGKEWVDGDPAFWTVKPAPATPAKPVKKN